MAQRQQQQQKGWQEGSRWIHTPPDGDELAAWFSANVKMHAGLDHADYLPGVTMIPNTEYVKQTVFDEHGNTSIVKAERLVYTPYPKVETRIAYFWDLMEIHPEWLGSIKLLAGTPQKNLPAGFFHMPVTGADGRTVTSFIGATYQVRIRERARHGRGQPVIEPAAGTKIVPLMKRGYNGVITPDEHAIHKAQTGAQGRALGFAGMLVVPGAGIATAEDMLEFLSGAGGEPSLPPVEPPPTGLEDSTAPLLPIIAELTAELESDHPAAYAEAVAWATEKGFDLHSPPAAALRGLERQLRRKLTAAQATAPSP